MDKKNWTAGRKKAAVLHLLAGEPLDSVSQDLAVTIAQLEGWKQRVINQMEGALKSNREHPFDNRSLEEYAP